MFAIFFQKTGLFSAHLSIKEETGENIYWSKNTCLEKKNA